MDYKSVQFAIAIYGFNKSGRFSAKVVMKSVL